MKNYTKKYGSRCSVSGGLRETQSLRLFRGNAAMNDLSIIIRNGPSLGNLNRSGHLCSVMSIDYLPLSLLVP